MPESYGTVHAAFGSGLRAAAHVLGERPERISLGAVPKSWLDQVGVERSPRPAVASSPRAPVVPPWYQLLRVPFQHSGKRSTGIFSKKLSSVEGTLKISGKVKKKGKKVTGTLKNRQTGPDSLCVTKARYVATK